MEPAEGALRAYPASTTVAFAVASALMEADALAAAGDLDEAEALARALSVHRGSAGWQSCDGVVSLVENAGFMSATLTGAL